MRLRLIGAIMGVLLALPGSGGQGAEPSPEGPPDAIIRTGLPIPRFVSIRASKVYLRTGPGERYPVEWTYQRPGLPVQITAEFDTWRRIRDPEGTVGWVHHSMLSGQRTVVVVGAGGVIRAEASPSARPVAQLQPGVTARLGRCTGDWCQVEVRREDVGRLAGWLRRTEVWGLAEGDPGDG